MGYNSFTQTPCLDNAILFDAVRPTSAPKPTDAAPQKQSVTYTSRLITSLSDLLEATTLSPASAIKSGTLNSSLFIDTDQFKDADLNYLLHVKVLHQAPQTSHENVRFNKLKGMVDGKFSEVFGDTYISAFLEGGEFTALVSVKTARGRKREEVAGMMKVAMQMAGEEGARARRGLVEGAEVAVSVNWTGGGKLKDGEYF